MGNVLLDDDYCAADCISPFERSSNNPRSLLIRTPLGPRKWTSLVVFGKTTGNWPSKGAASGPAHGPAGRFCDRRQPAPVPAYASAGRSCRTCASDTRPMVERLRQMPDLMAASFTALPTAGPTFGLNTLGMM